MKSAKSTSICTCVLALHLTVVYFEFAFETHVFKLVVLYEKFIIILSNTKFNPEQNDVTFIKKQREFLDFPIEKKQWHRSPTRLYCISS